MVSCLTSLVACSQNGQPSGSGGTSAVSTSSDKITLTFWQAYPGQRETVCNEAIKRFMQKHPNVKVESLTLNNDSYKQKMAVAMSGGNPPDVFHSWGGGDLKKYVDQGNVLDLTGKIDTSSFNQLSIGNTTFEDKLYGIPLGLSIDCFWYNKDIFAACGLGIPKTWDDFVNAINILKGKKYIPIALANQPKWPAELQFAALADRIGGSEMFTNALNRKGSFADKGFVEAGEYLQNLVKMEAYNSGANGIPYDAGQGRQMFYSGQAAMIYVNNNFLGNVLTENPDFKKKLGVFLFPSIPDGKGDPSDIGATTAPTWSVSSKTKHPQEAIELVKELSSLETAQAFADESGSMTAVLGVKYDGFLKTFSDFLANAKNIYWAYDQTLPADVAQTSMDATQGIIGQTINPSDAAAAVEAKAKTSIG